MRRRPTGGRGMSYKHFKGGFDPHTTYMGIEFVKARGKAIVNTGYLNYKWYVRENDLIGGWCVMPLDEPPSYGVAEVADFLTKECADHIAELHNEWLERKIKESDEKA